MQPQILAELERMIDEHFHVSELNSQLKTFVHEKADEKSLWSNITIYCHKMLGGNSPHIDKLAAITEMMMLALDIVDDLQDQDNIVKPWMKCEPEYAMNAVLSFIFAALLEMDRWNRQAQSTDKTIVGDVCRYITQAGNGQFIDIHRSIVTEQDYVMAVQQKSGSLIQFACYMGYSCLDDLDPAVAQQMDELAAFIGFINQLENDIRDVQRYDVKNDLLQKKKTLPILYLLQHSDEDFPEFKQYYDGIITQKEFIGKKMECLNYIIDSGCIEYSKIIQTLFVNRAEKIWDSIPAISPWKEKFYDMMLSPFKIDAGDRQAQA